jgi:hypothetical protein
LQEHNSEKGFETPRRKLQNMTKYSIHRIQCCRIVNFRETIVDIIATSRQSSLGCLKPSSVLTRMYSSFVSLG